MQLSVIILNYNVRYFLEVCLQSVSLALKNIDSEIIVVDNASPDDSCAMIREKFPNVILIQNPENTGFPKGNNIGVAAAKGEYVCILNPDTVVSEYTFTDILSFAVKLRNPGIIGCRLIDGTGKFLPESKRGIPTPGVSFAKIAGLYKLSNKYFGKYYASHLKNNQSGPVDVLVGAFMFLKKDLYLELKGFDEDYFMCGEDIDFCYRVLKSGRRNYFFADTTIIHYKGESTIRDAKYRRRFRDGMAIFYQKHFASSGFAAGILQFGMSVFSSFKVFQRSVSKRKPKKNVLISNKSESLEKLEETFAGNIEMKTLEKFGQDLPQTFAKNRHVRLIFDISYQSFYHTISSFEIFKNYDVSYRILPQNADFMIGSDSSSDRGEVVNID